MDYYKSPILPMAGPERELMAFFLKQVKHTFGLKSALDKIAGINGKWFNHNEPFNISASKMMKALALKSLIQEEDEFVEDAKAFRRYAIDFCNAHGITTRVSRKSFRLVKTPIFLC